MESALVRTVVASELAEATRLLQFVNPETPSEVLHERLTTLLRDHPHYHLFGAFIGDRLVGVSGAWIATKIWCGLYLEIDNLVVNPEIRSAGIGSLLIQTLEKLAIEKRCNIMTLDSYATNHPSHRLYHRLGFEIWSFHFIKTIGDWKGSGKA